MIARALRNAPRACIAAPRRGLGALRARLADLVEDRGETEVLQYGAMKWTVRDAKRYGDGLARGLAEFGVQAGPTEVDITVEQHSVKIVVDKKSEFFMGGTELDFNDGLLDRGFVFKNPQASGTCGCGTSFSA